MGLGFLLVEGDQLINLSLISRVELCHDEHKRYAKLWNAGVLEFESKIAYDYFTNPANAAFLMAPVGLAE